MLWFKWRNFQNLTNIECHNKIVIVNSFLKETSYNIVGLWSYDTLNQIIGFWKELSYGFVAS